MRFGSRYLFTVLVFGATLSAEGQRRETEIVAFHRPEAWAMRYFAGAVLMQGNGAPPGLERGNFALGLEAAHIPHISLEKRTVGFYGTKEENLNKAPVVVRPLLHYAATDRLSVTAAYVPPVEIFRRLRSELAGVSLDYDAFARGALSCRVRAVAQWSRSRGDFTVAADVAGDPDPARNPFGAPEPSRDVFKSRTASAELELALRLPVERPVSAFVNAAYTFTDLVFQVDAVLEGGFHDTARISTSGGMRSYGAGFRAALTDPTARDPLRRLRAAARAAPP